MSREAIGSILERFNYNADRRIITGLLPLDNLAFCKALLIALNIAVPTTSHGIINRAEPILRSYWDMPTTTECYKMADEKKMKAPKEKAPKEKKPGRGPGVIAEIIRVASRTRGATINEVVDELAKKFPDRSPKSMKTTTGIQLSTGLKKRGLTVTKEKDEKRGTVYTVAAA